MSNGIPLDQFWEKDDGERMDGLIRIERFIKSQGTDSAQIWGAWYDIKQLVKAALEGNMKSKICDKCESSIAPRYPFCPWCGAAQSKGRRKTVREKRPVQHRKGRICPRCEGFGLVPTDMNRGGRCWRCKGSGRLSPVA